MDRRQFDALQMNPFDKYLQAGDLDRLYAHAAAQGQAAQVNFADVRLGELLLGAS